MSCFESSTFLKNSAIMNMEYLKKACQQLGWQFEIKQEGNKQALYITTAGNQSNLHGEYALKVVDNEVTYNSYYLKNGKQLVKELEQEFYGLNVQYAKQAVLTEFESMGFKYLPEIEFVPDENVRDCFKMVAHSRITEETEKRVEIEFKIMFDGTVVTDSNYIPEDVHKLADKAMEAVDRAFGTQRKEGEQIKRKEIPAKYRNKTYCKAGSKIIAKH